MLGAYRRKLQRLADALAAPFITLGLPPTFITILALPPALAAAWYASERAWALALVLATVAGLLDFVDGTVARTTGRVTAFGGVLDSLVDRVVDLAFLFSIGILLDTREAWLWVAAALAGAYGTSYTRARAQQDHRLPRETWNQFFERPERLILLGLAAIAQGVLEAQPNDAHIVYGREVIHWALVLFAILAWGTLIQRVIAAQRALRAAVSRAP